MAQPSEAQVFERLQSYSFTSDPEFANGLSIILGHPNTPATEVEMNRDDDLVLQAKCFFFSRKENLTPAIDFAAFKSWLAGRATEPQGLNNTALQISEASDPGTSGPESSTNPEPAYPSSFAHIVELITTGQPIPGIQDIPDTVLSGHDISSEKPRRRKPWEKDEVVTTFDETASAAP
ncbi:hypothetical protein PEX1_026200 [Penicillium expansum]|uniref:Uncharacterized protein n=1 Tax=Penicillium expansum TaxID=27334 RepID=A0A0A2KQD4_PENEN|nr:hypothetical protein PEX2_033910 [Penicillium expansum]KGO36643.1 hypothetical protein PEXP_004780 [Penicillium expansum]KGO60402.1 hypothetical protein PEX2_033910 [Penicillium expansum]KGO69101.1 hypothetical protein PEX1_026200 [Penicillium expansum]